MKGYFYTIMKGDRLYGRKNGELKEVLCPIPIWVDKNNWYFPHKELSIPEKEDGYELVKVRYKI